MKRVIITGATGAVGTAFLRECIKNQIEVLVLYREESARKENIPSDSLIKLRPCSLENLKDLNNNSDKEYDVFYHLGWNGTTGAERNDTYLQNKNVEYTLDAVDVAYRFGCKKFVGVGSQAEYGRVNCALTPDTPTNPETGYGMAKLCAGNMARLKAQTLGISYNWIRILSIYGPNDGKQSLIMSTIDKLKQGVAPKLTKGDQLWDYLYSDDAAQALRLIGENGLDGKTYVLGSGDAKPLRKYIEKIRDIVNPDCKLKFGAIPYSDTQVMHLEADITDLELDLGFAPSTKFTEGIKQILKTV